MPALYQSTWNGIDLVDIAKDQTRLQKGAPNALFYEEFYRRLKGEKFRIQDGWRAEKGRVCDRLRFWLAEEARMKRTSPKLLRSISVAAGLGIVEKPLIEEGYDITLHDVAESNFDFLREAVSANELPKFRFLAGDLRTLQTEPYDIVYVGTCEYCYVTKDTHVQFLRSLRSILRPGGRIIAWDMIPSALSYVSAVRARLPFRRTKTIRWGNIRSVSERYAAFRRAGLEISKLEIYKGDWRDPSWSGSHPPRFRLTASGEEFGVIHARRAGKEN